MSKLATAMHAQPPGSWVRPNDLKLQHHQVLLDQHAQCHRAFLQDPTPRLGAALKQLERELKNIGELK